MRRLSRILIFVGLVLAVVSSSAGAATPAIAVLRIDGPIVPAVASYIDRGISRAEAGGYAACIIELRTPGGILDTTREIVERMIAAKVPVVVFVPAGSWAASAGAFITLAAHVAVMAPASRIGAASPIAGGGQDIGETAKKKVTEDTAAMMRSIAEERGRDVDAAQLAVTEAKSYTASEALEHKLIDFMATSIEDLVNKLDGRKVKLLGGQEVTMSTRGYPVMELPMSQRERLLQVVSDPNIAYILLSLAVIGLITEISHPGLIFPGVFGGVSLLLAFYSLGVLDAYWGGVGLILLAFGLFVAEIFTPAFGILTAGGITSMVMGSLILFGENAPLGGVNRGLIAAVTILITAFAVFVIWAVIRGQRRGAVTGKEGLVGSGGVARSELAPRGTVLAEGELWDAVSSEGRIEAGEVVVVEKVEGLKLTVNKRRREA